MIKEKYRRANADIFVGNKKQLPGETAEWKNDRIITLPL